jgi:hypothetical protein
MQELIIESVVIGIITSILGSVMIKILSKVNSVESHDYLNNFVGKYKKTYIIEISMFFTGILIHLLLEYVGLNKWYCEKKCAGEGLEQKCQMVCTKDII